MQHIQIALVRTLVSYRFTNNLMEIIIISTDATKNVNNVSNKNLKFKKKLFELLWKPNTMYSISDRSFYQLKYGKFSNCTNSLNELTNWLFYKKKIFYSLQICLLCWRMHYTHNNIIIIIIIVKKNVLMSLLCSNKPLWWMDRFFSSIFNGYENKNKMVSCLRRCECKYK